MSTSGTAQSEAAEKVNASLGSGKPPPTPSLQKPKPKQKLRARVKQTTSSVPTPSLDATENPPIPVLPAPSRELRPQRCSHPANAVGLFKRTQVEINAGLEKKKSEQAARKRQETEDAAKLKQADATAAKALAALEDALEQEDEDDRRHLREAPSAYFQQAETVDGMGEELTVPRAQVCCSSAFQKSTNFTDHNSREWTTS